MPFSACHIAVCVLRYLSPVSLFLVSGWLAEQREVVAFCPESQETDRRVASLPGLPEGGGSHSLLARSRCERGSTTAFGETAFSVELRREQTNAADEGGLAS
jgi:hypothetical protein